MAKNLSYINFVLTLLIIAFLTWYVFLKKPAEQIVQNTSVSTQTDSCGENCKEQVEKIVSDSLTSVSADTKVVEKETVKTVTVTPAPTSSKKQTVYLPIPGNSGSTSTDWVDVPGTDFYLDWAKDYGEEAYLTWDASLKVLSGNGSSYARIYDVTNKIAVNGSEVSTSGNSDLEQVFSGQLYPWRGRNLYRVQIKSLNGYEATFGGGRVKIYY